MPDISKHIALKQHTAFSSGFFSYNVRATSWLLTASLGQLKFEKYGSPIFKSIVLFTLKLVIQQFPMISWLLSLKDNSQTWSNLADLQPLTWLTTISLKGSVCWLSVIPTLLFSSSFQTNLLSQLLCQCFPVVCHFFSSYTLFSVPSSFFTVLSITYSAFICNMEVHMDWSPYLANNTFSVSNMQLHEENLMSKSEKKKSIGTYDFVFENRATSF